MEIQSNFPPALMIGLRDTFGLLNFVETGTYIGNTALLAALAFPAVTTVEIDGDNHKIAAERLRGLPHVKAIYSSSMDFLKTTDWSREVPTLFYLDAHWPADSALRDDETNCPLKHELAIIGGLYGKHCIVVDDLYYQGVLPHIDGWGHVGFDEDDKDAHYTVLMPFGPGKRWT